MRTIHRRKALAFHVACALAAGTVAIDSGARITKIQITSTAPAYGGVAIGDVGPYERVVGKAFGEVSPTDSHNNMIVDVGLAPKNSRGNVEYSFDFYILKPVDLSKGSRRVMYEPPNRGGKQYATFNRSTGGNDPAASTNPLQTFLAPRGYTMVWSGWDAAAGTDNSNFVTTITLPVAKNADGTSITGPAYEYIVMGNATTTSYTLTYAAASADQTKGTLTWRKHLDDVPQVIAASGWAYTDATNSAIKLTTGPFNANDIYEFSYTAKDPTVNGLGFAAVRDFNSFLRFATKDDSGTANPLAGSIDKIYTFISSQPGRMLNDFRNLGFNEDESGRKVFDGMMQWISAGDGINMNLRFSQPGRTERNRQDQFYAEGIFPFANQKLTDHITGKTAGRYDKCTASNTCPLGMEVYSANEYWVKGASLFHTDTKGTVDLADHPMARLYFISSHQHGVGNGTSKGVCQQLGNPLNVFPTMRALWLAMDAWATNGTAPPASAVPKLSDGTLVAPLPQSGMGFPTIPGVQYTGLKSTRYLWNYGPRFDQGIMDINPPAWTPPFFDNPNNGKIYPTFIPKTDSDGNDIAGIRILDVRVPLATYTGWSLRSAANDGPDGCEGSGQMIPFPKTAADRIASGDPRLSVAERYGSFSGYYYARLKAANDMMSQGLLLPEDAFAEFSRGLASVMTDYGLKRDGADD
ncbi:MAG: alpha/beta hydrolase domain-containing protein [Usitatibacter sp.]